MPIDLYTSLKKTSQWAFGSPILNSVLGSSVFMSIAIALLMIVLIMVMYPAKSGTGFSVIFKMFVYMTFGSLLLVFLHDCVLKYMIEEERHAIDAEDLMRNTTDEGKENDPVYGSYSKVSPGITGGTNIGITIGAGSGNNQTSLDSMLAQPASPPPATVINIGTPVVEQPTSGGYDGTTILGGRLPTIKPPMPRRNPFK